MARIPMGNFGEGGGTAPLVRTRVQGGDDPVAQALGGLAQTGMQLAHRASSQGDPGAAEPSPSTRHQRAARPRDGGEGGGHRCERTHAVRRSGLAIGRVRIPAGARQDHRRGCSRAGSRRRRASAGRPTAKPGGSPADGAGRGKRRQAQRGQDRDVGLARHARQAGRPAGCRYRHAGQAAYRTGRAMAGGWSRPSAVRTDPPGATSTSGGPSTRRAAK